MKEASELTNQFHFDEEKLKKDYNEMKAKNKTLKKLIDTLELPDEYLMKYTSSLEETANELDNCKKCKNLLECKNTVQGHVIYPELLSNNLVFDYVPCKYQKQYEEDNKYKNNIKNLTFYFIFLILLYVVCELSVFN